MSSNSVPKVEKHKILDLIVASGVLGSSKNQLALFKYLMDAKFDGKNSDITTKQIAIDIFNRDSSFSTKKDSIVRVEMHRLRGNLDSFNKQSDSVAIELPKSSYDLQIKLIEIETIPEEPAKEMPPEKRSWTKFAGAGAIAAIGIMALVFTGGYPGQTSAECSAIVPNIEITDVTKNNPKDDLSLNSYVDQVMRGAASQFGHVNIVGAVKKCDEGVPQYRLEYTVLKNGNGFRGNLSTVSVIDEKIINVSHISGVFDREQIHENAFEDDLFFSIAKPINDVISPGALIHRHAGKQKWRDRSRSHDYNCFVQMYESFISDSDEDYYAGLACLKQSYENGTPLLENLGGLAASYLEQAMGNRGSKKEDPFLLAKDIIDSVGDRWLDNPETTTAKIMYDSVRPDYNDQQLKGTLFAAAQTYNSNPMIITEVSRYSGFILGDWDYAVKTMERAKRLTSFRGNAIFHVDAADAILSRANPDAWKNCVKTYSKYSKMSNLLVNACAKKYDKPVWVQKTSDNLMELNLKTRSEKKQFLDGMGFERSLTAAILDSNKNNLYD